MRGPSSWGCGEGQTGRRALFTPASAGPDPAEGTPVLGLPASRHPSGEPPGGPAALPADAREERPRPALLSCVSADVAIPGPGGSPGHSHPGAQERGGQGHSTSQKPGFQVLLSLWGAAVTWGQPVAEQAGQLRHGDHLHRPERNRGVLGGGRAPVPCGSLPPPLPKPP